MSDHRSDLGTDRSADPTAWRARNWGDTEIVVIVGAMAVNLVLLAFTLCTYSFLTAAPKISTSELATTGKGGVAPLRYQTGLER